MSDKNIAYNKRHRLKTRKKMLKISIYFLPFLFSLGISDDSIFAFDGTFQKGLEFYEFPTSIKLDWFNFLDSEGPLIRCGGKSVISELGIFGVEMEITMDEFDRRYFSFVLQF